MSELAIIGGGVSGLAAGIYAQMSGLESEIFESHTVVGGQCTSWTRKGFHIDNCVHWMTGTSPKKEIYKVWQEVGVITKEEDILRHDYFLQVDIDGVKAHVWRNLDKMKQELLSVAPEDEKEIKKFIKLIKTFQAIELPSMVPNEQMGFCRNMKLVLKMLKAIPAFAKYQKLTLAEYAQRFKSPIIHRIIYNYVPEQFYVISAFYMYAMFTMGNADLPVGGSDSITNRMRDKYLSLGGKISTKKKAINVEINNKKITKIKFTDGSDVQPKYVIFATDPDVTFNVIGRQYLDEHFKFSYEHPDLYPVFSDVNLYFAIDGKIKDLPIMEIFNCEPYQVAGRDHKVIITNNYTDQPNFAPEGKDVMQILMVQYDYEYKYWDDLYNTDREKYKAEKQRIADDILKRLETHYPQYKGKFTLLEVVTPKSFNRFLGSYKGSYMGFIQTPYTKKEVHKGVIEGLDNLYLAGQWLQTPGGLPNALVTGKFAIQRLLKRENMSDKFCSVKKH
ncbi:MAG: NAD(P)/FAD-dependent oxidoreductase [Bacteroidales bacterium]|nr:NAD(P)/FAD-dependent oxidoreductase [Bacteroidales bacterium]